MYTYKKCLVTVFGALGLTLLMISPASAGVYESLENAISAVQGTDPSSFVSPQLKDAYEFDLNGIDSTMIIAEDETETESRNQLYQDALDTVDKLISKTDGCDANGIPDAEDWIQNCADATPVKTALSQLAADIAELIQ